MLARDTITVIRRVGLVIAAVAIVVLALGMTYFVRQSQASARASQGVTQRLKQLQSENDTLKRQLKESEQIQSRHFAVKADWDGAGHKQALAKVGATTCFGCHDPVDCEPCHTKSAGP